MKNDAHKVLELYNKDIRKEEQKTNLQKGESMETAKTVNVNFKLDIYSKKEFERICSKLGLNISSALNMYVQSVIREKRIPLNLSLDEETDSFYSPENIAYLDGLYEKYKKGEIEVVKHDLIEA